MNRKKKKICNEAMVCGDLSGTSVDQRVQTELNGVGEMTRACAVKHCQAETILDETTGARGTRKEKELDAFDRTGVGEEKSQRKTSSDIRWARAQRSAQTSCSQRTRHMDPGG